MTEINIREENQSDYKAVYELTKAAFSGTECSDGTEHDLVERLRKSDFYIPKLSLVAESGGRIVGHIMFTKAVLSGYKAVLLAPVSVLPQYQKQGIGGALIRSGHERAADLGYDISFLVGHSDYYPRFGYERASLYGVDYPFEAPDECKMLKFLKIEPMVINQTPAFAPEYYTA